MTYHDRGPARRGLRLDPVLVEAGAALAWLAVGTLGLSQNDASGLGTLVLAVGIVVLAAIVVENRRRGPRVFDAARSMAMLRYGVLAVVVIVVASVLLGLADAAAFLPGLAAAVTGGAFVLLARDTGQRPTAWLGWVLVALGVLSAIVSLQAATNVVSQGLLGIVAGVLLALSAADRVGLLGMLRDRVR